MASGSSVISSTVTQNTALRLTDAEPLARLIVDRSIVATPRSSPFASIDELLDGVPEESGRHHLVRRLRRRRRPYPGRLDRRGVRRPDATTCATSRTREAARRPPPCSAGRSRAGVTGYSEWRGLAQEGRMRILASASPDRFGDRQIPTLREAGLDVLFHQWRGVFAPPGLKAEHLAWWQVVDRAHARQRSLAPVHYQGAGGRTAIWHATISGGWSTPIRNATFRRSPDSASSGRPAALPQSDHTRCQQPSVWRASRLSGATAVEHLRAPDRPIAAAASEDDDEGGDPPRIWNRLFLGVALSLAYIAALRLIGFLIATPLFLVALGLLMRSARPFRDALAGVGLTRGDLADVHPAALREPALRRCARWTSRRSPGISLRVSESRSSLTT